MLGQYIEDHVYHKLCVDWNENSIWVKKTYSNMMAITKHLPIMGLDNDITNIFLQKDIKIKIECYL